MAKSRSKQNSKQASRKKRDKRRLLRQQACPARPWQSVDVSRWFDTIGCPEAKGLDMFFPGSDDLPDVVYEDVLPGELLYNYYAHDHPDQEEELLAVMHIRHLLMLEANADSEAEGEARPKKAILKDLEKLAKEGSATASTFLGSLYAVGMDVRKNYDRAESYLRYAASKDDPFACFFLARLLELKEEEEESEQFLDKSCAGGCLEAISARIQQISSGTRGATSSELDMLASYLAAFAVNGSFKSLKALLEFMGTFYGHVLDSEYAHAMLRLLNGLEEEDYAPAVEYKAELLSAGMLVEENLEEAKRLHLKARALGSETAYIKYASCLLHETNDDDMTREAKEEHVRAARKILEEEYASGKYLPVVDGLLGCILVMSDDDADFSKGIQHLESNLSENFEDMPLRAAVHILLWSDKPERHKQAIRLLNTMVRKKNPNAIFIRGRLYLEGGLAGRQDVEKGMKMLEEAATEMGVGDAWLLLAEISVFGLFNVESDKDTIETLLTEGSKISSRCAVLSCLMQLGEIPNRANVHMDIGDMQEVVHDMFVNATRDNNYLSVAIAMVHLGADTPLRNCCQDFGLDLWERSEQELSAIVEEVASDCDDNMQSCNLGPLCYLALAMRKIGKTEHADLAAGIFASKLNLGQGASCDDIADYLQKFVASAPESYVQYRLARSTNDTDEDRPLF